MTGRASTLRSAPFTPPLEQAADSTVSVGLEPILCSQAEAWKMLAIGKTLGAALLASGQLESVRIGSRRLVKIASVKFLAEHGK